MHVHMSMYGYLCVRAHTASANAHCIFLATLTCNQYFKELFNGWVARSNMLVNEGLDFKIERVVKLAKSARSDLSQLNGVDIGIEEQIIRFFELKDEVTEYQGLLRECEADPAAKEEPAKEKVVKAKHILDEIETTIKQTGTESFTEKLKTENEFNVGIQKNLIPWIDNLENDSLKQLAKPDNFEHAREIERDAVLFAKDVRKANKLLQQLESSIEKLPDMKMFANQQIQEQKVRFKNIATIAATRVETMRDLLVNWNFFLETKGELLLDAIFLSYS